MASPDPRVADRRRPYRPAHRSALRRASGWLRVGLANVHLALAGFAGLAAVEMWLAGRPLWMLLFATSAAFGFYSRLGVWVVAAAALAHNLVGGAPSNHVALLFWAALAVASLTGDDLRRTFRVLVASVYGFAVANKLVGGVDLLAQHIHIRGGLPAELAAVGAVGAVAVQAYLVWAVLRKHWTALPVAAALHVGITVTMSNNLHEWVAMASFNGLAVWVVYAAAD